MAKNFFKSALSPSLVILLSILIIQDLVFAGYLELNPPLEQVIRLAGEEHSFFVSCIPFSDIGPVGDSRVRARELRWQKRQKPPLGDGWVTLGTQPHERVHVEQSSDGRGLDLVFRSIESIDDGDYSCEAILDGKREFKKFQLNVMEPISFAKTPPVQSVEEGTQKFTLICNVTGNPKPEVTWNVRGQLIRPGQVSDKYGVTSQGLTIYNISRSDQGSYKCKATQLDESVADFKDLVIQLNVQHQPEWPAEQRGEFYGFISGIANLTCEAHAEPPATFSWLDKNNKEITFGRVHNEHQRSTLSIEVTHDALFGVYTCVAQNKMGSLRKAVILSEGAKPGIPVIKVEKIDHSSVELIIQEHKAEMYLDIIGFRVEYKEKNDNWDKAKVLFFKKSPDRSYTIDSLSAKTFYYIKATAQNLAGYSDPSNMIYLQTKAPHSVEELVGSNSRIMASSQATLSRTTTAVIFFLISISTISGKMLTGQFHLYSD